METEAAVGKNFLDNFTFSLPFANTDKAKQPLKI